MATAARVIPVILGVLAVAGGLVCTLMLVVLFLASMPNSKPDDLRLLKLAGWASFIGGLACAGGAIWLLCVGRPWWGAGVGIVPFIAIIAVFTWASIR